MAENILQPMIRFSTPHERHRVFQENNFYFSRDKEGIIYSTKGMLRLLNNEYQCFTFETQYGYHR